MDTLSNYFLLWILVIHIPHLIVFSNGFNSFVFSFICIDRDCMSYLSRLVIPFSVIFILFPSAYLFLIYLFWMVFVLSSMLFLMICNPYFNLLLFISFLSSSLIEYMCCITVQRTWGELSSLPWVMFDSKLSNLYFSLPACLPAFPTFLSFFLQ